jgi:hypothetical protein
MGKGKLLPSFIGGSQPKRDECFDAPLKRLAKADSKNRPVLGEDMGFCVFRPEGPIRSAQPEGLGIRKSSGCRP